MEKPPRQETLELKVTDFGPIAKAEIDLRPLTVFIGPSNTGKSYLAILIYALHSLFERPADFPPRPSRKSPKLSDSSIQQLIDWAEDNGAAGKKGTAESKTQSLLSENIAALIRPVLRDGAEVGSVLNDEIGRCFGVEEEAVTELLTRHRSRNAAKIILRGRLPEAPQGTEPFGYDFSLKGSGVETTVLIPAKMPLQIEQVPRPILGRFLNRLRQEPDPKYRQRRALALLNDLAGAVMPSIIGPLSRYAFYLPADRAGVMHTHRAVVIALVQSAASAGLHRAPQVPTLSGVLADFLGQLIEMDDTQRPKGRVGNSFADYLERDMLKGLVRTELSDTGYPSFFYRPDGWKRNLPLMNTSSMVSELAPVVLYLRHLVERGDTLIIEEPESHLHPEMQATFAQHLAGLVRKGIRVIVTTHSEWLLDQLANLVRMSGLDETQRKGLSGGNVALSPDQFGAWLFKPKQRPKGSFVEEIRIDPDAGGLLSDYSDTAEQLYGTWAEIGNRIAESKDAKGQ